MQSTDIPICGAVLAGGKSSRMGTDKSLVQLGGVRLIERAVETLRQVCTEVVILGSNPALEIYGPLVPDLHPGCGPLGGIEAALAHSRLEWNLLLPVDMPFVPTALLRSWIARVTSRPNSRVAYFEVGERPQPGLLLIRRGAQEPIRASMARGDYKLLPAIHTAAGADGLWLERLDGAEAEGWFANINTPDALQAAEQRLASGLGRPSGAS